MIQWFLTTLLIVTALPLQAQEEPPWYQIELMIFKNNMEHAPEHLTRDRIHFEGRLLQDYEQLLGEWVHEDDELAESMFLEIPFVELPPNLFFLQQTEQKMNQNPNYSMLAHIAWRQPITRDAPGVKIQIHGGDSLREQGYPSSKTSVWELEGDVAISLLKYPHAMVDLQLAEYPQDGGAMSFVGMQSRKKIDTKRVHYLDHPRIGVLLKLSALADIVSDHQPLLQQNLEP